MIKQIIVIALLVNYSLCACTASSTAATSVTTTGTDDYGLGKCCQTTTTVAVKHAGVKTCVAHTGTALAETSAATCNFQYYLSTNACLACATGTSSVGETTTSCTLCADEQYPKASDGTCAARDAAATAITGCRVYDAATAGNCIVAEDGFQTITTGQTTALTACIANCQTCTGTTANLCSVAQDGFFKDTTDAAAHVIKACDTGCATCEFLSTAATKSKCLSASAGYSYDATNFKATLCANGQGSADKNTLATCTACDTTQNCATCSTTLLCKTCQPGYVFAANACTLFDVAKVHGTCAKASAEGESGCNTCDATKNREMEMEAPVAPATTSTIAKTLGKCNCQATYGDNQSLATPNFGCTLCGDNVATCQFNQDGTKSELTCATGFFKAGQLCLASSAADVAGFYFDTKDFQPCQATNNCLTCNATSCLKCPEYPTGWTEPTSSAANFASYLKTRVVVNGQCVSDCPTNFAPNSNKNGCIASANAGGAAKANSNILVILSVLASLLIIF